MVAVMMALHSCEGPLARRVHATRVADVIQAVSKVWDCAPANISKDSFIRQFSHPRFAVYWIAHRVLERSLPQIGGILGRDHTSVLSGVSRADNLCVTDMAFRARLLAALEVLGLPEPILPKAQIANLKGVN
jgi:chromosomal replication initiation ATPase DnaA